jgi:hypothetical protein
MPLSISINVPSPVDRLVLEAVEKAEDAKDSSAGKILPSEVIPASRSDLFDTYVALAEHRELEKAPRVGYVRWALGRSFQAASSTYRMTMRRFFQRNDPLRENIPDSATREEYDAKRAEYIKAAESKFQGDKVVAAITKANYADLQELLSDRLENPARLYAYFDLAIMMPNEGVLSLLMDALDVNKTHSVSTLSIMTPGDFAAILSLLVTPHLPANLFKTFFIAHPPIDGSNLIKDVIEEMVEAKPAIFINYFAACADLMVMGGGGIKKVLDEYIKHVDNGRFEPQKIAWAALFIYVSVESGKKYMIDVSRILKAHLIAKAQSEDYIRGLDEIATQSGILLKMATSTAKGLLPRAENLSRLAFELDPKMTVATENGLIGLLDLYSIVLQRSSHHGSLHIQIREQFDRLSTAKFTTIKLGVLGFIARTGLVVPNEGWWPLSRWTPDQSTMLEMIKYIHSLNLPRLAPCTWTLKNPEAFVIRHVYIGHILNDKLFAKLDYNEIHALVYATLATTFRMPTSIFGCAQSLVRFGPIDQLNFRLKCFCGNEWPTIIFEAERSGVATAWETRESYRITGAKARKYKLTFPSSPKNPQVPAKVNPPKEIESKTKDTVALTKEPESRVKTDIISPKKSTDLKKKTKTSKGAKTSDSGKRSKNDKMVSRSKSDKKQVKSPKSDRSDRRQRRRGRPSKGDKSSVKSSTKTQTRVKNHSKRSLQKGKTLLKSSKAH